MKQTLMETRGTSSQACPSKCDEAIVEYTKGDQISPKDARLYIDRGLVYRAATKLPEAMADFTKAIELEPKNELGYYFEGLRAEQTSVRTNLIPLSRT